MAQIKVGLNTGRKGYWDPLTKTNLSLADPVKVVNYSTADELKNICHALFSSHPALKLYEGQIPAAAIDTWKARFDFSGLQMAKNRADKINSESASIITGANVGQAEEVTIESTQEPVEEVKAQEEKPEHSQEVYLATEEIENMTKQEMQDFIKEHHINIEFNSKTNATELKELLKEHFEVEK